MSGAGVKIIAVFSLLLAITSCSSYQATAPVQDATIEKKGIYLIHRVETGETLYSIAWQYECDYRDLVRINRLSAPYSIYPGQSIYLNFSPYEKRKAEKQIAPIEQRKVLVPETWMIPVKGKVIRRFSSLTKGIDIEGKPNKPIYAAADGVVVYAGDAIRGFGHLLIISHGGDILTAYGYNKSLLVQENQKVKKGQSIATMGQDKAGNFVLHFEVRLKGKPVDPGNYVHY